MSVNILILAAGQGTRMKSRIPKLLHPVGGVPMIRHVLDAARGLAPQRLAVVVAPDSAALRSGLGDAVEMVEQAEQLGTGHAVLQAQARLAGSAETVVVLYGDTPLLSSMTLRRLLDRHTAIQPAITMLTADVADPALRPTGRVVRGPGGTVQAIVEEPEATPEQRALTECNMGVYAFRDNWLWEHVGRLRPSAAKGEYYLTDLVSMALAEGERVEAVTMDDFREALGINTRGQLAAAERILRDRIRAIWLDAGVTMLDPDSVWIDQDVEIGQDTVLLPHTHLQGRTVIGSDCVIGPDTLIRNSSLGNRCQVSFSVVEEAVLEDDVRMGPYSHLRKGAHLAQGADLGNYAEVKNSYIGPGTKMHHFSYVGDATVGEKVNIGAGTITCNYDGIRKHRTVIEDGAFIGSDTMLVAPVKVGARSRTGAGSVVTRDIPPDSLAFGVPARVKEEGKGS